MMMLLIILFFPFFLAACTRLDRAVDTRVDASVDKSVDESAGPSLNADDLWDQMAAERDKPLPVVASGLSDGETDEIRDAMPVVSSPDLSANGDSDTDRSILLAAQKKYQVITTSLEKLSQSTGTAEDDQARWRSMQLYLSRLTSLNKAMEQAINRLEPASADQALLVQSRDLRTLIIDHIARTQKYLTEFH